MSSKIYYFSGTGNSLAIARELKDMFDENSSVVPMSVLNDKKTIKIDTDILGFVFPVYYMNVPEIVKSFVEKLVFETDPYIFAIATCNGIPGPTLFELKKCLSKKGKILSSGFVVDMPGNAIVTKPEVIDERLKNYKSKVSEISNYVNNKSMNKLQGKDGLKSHIESSIIKFFGNKLYITPENVSVTKNCVGCGICAKVCPLNNIKIVNKRPQWGQKCANCLACFHWCPKKAVKGGTMLQKRDTYHHPEISIEDMDNTSSYEL